MNPLVAVSRRLAYAVWYRRARRSLERADRCSLFDLDLIIPPGVLHPRHFASSRVLGECIRGLTLRDKCVADIGTGCGIQALLAARSGGTVTAVDINPLAVECAALNAGRNHLSERVSVVASDVFDSVDAGLRFDLLITNPPFYPRPPKSVADRAFAAGVGNEFFSKLVESLPGRLKPEGSVLMLHSSDADFEPIRLLFGQLEMPGRVVSESRGLFETLTIHEFTARA